jgi:hypothetical protein
MFYRSTEIGLFMFGAFVFFAFLQTNGFFSDLGPVN